VDYELPDDFDYSNAWVEDPSKWGWRNIFTILHKVKLIYLNEYVFVLSLKTLVFSGILGCMNNRSYNQFCALAYALDRVGDRWTLLIIRELLAGPRRFKDLLDGLPEISTNLLADRLKSLEQQGTLCRRVLPPPAGSTVYELSPVGRALEGAVLELGKWGSQFLPPSCEGIALPSVGSVALAIQTFFHPELAQDIDETVELYLGHEVLQVQINHGELLVSQGQTRRPDVVFRTETECFMSMFTGRIQPEEAIREGLVRVEGDPGALSRFFRLCGVPITQT